MRHTQPGLQLEMIYQMKVQQWKRRCIFMEGELERAQMAVCDLCNPYNRRLKQAFWFI